MAVSRMTPSAEALPQLFSELMARSMKPEIIWSVGPPTMAGVMASYATLGDVIVAEPGALIGFAGARVIKETTNQDLPEGFQTSEFLLKRGLIDMMIHRKEMKSKLASLLRALAHRKVKTKAVKSRA